MKKAIFLPIICLLAFAALFSVISCEKTETVQSEGITERKPVPEPTQKIPLEFEDINEVQIEGLLVKSGDKISFKELKEKAPDFFEQNVPERMRSKARAFILDTMPSWSTNWTWSQNCTCGAEYCPTLGAEVQGKKNASTWVQCDSRASYEWWKQMAYYDDVKSLANYGYYHHFRHINYNAKGTLTVSLFYSDPVTQQGVFVDIDGPIVVGDYGNYTWCSTYHENKVINSTPDENGVYNFYTSCATCDPCP